MTCAVGSLNVLSGPNGTGKTSLLDVIALRADLPPGSLIKRIGHAKAEEIAYLPQQLWDILDIRIFDLLLLALGTRTVPGSCPETLQPIFLKRSKELGSLSGGQRQLLLFWLVFLQAKPVYVYDEPFRYLDKIAVNYVSHAIESQVVQGKLVIISEHCADTQWKVPCNYLMLERNTIAIP
jgi:ABC-type Mn2+/Zn2+ transport system ATPase subunit